MSRQYEQVGDDEADQQELHEGVQPVVVQVEAEEAVEADAAQQTAVVEPEDAITVKVKSTDEKNHNVRVSASGTVAELKSVLAELTGFPVERQRLISLGKLLQDGKTLAECNVRDGNFVHLVPKPVAQPQLARGGSSSGSSPSVPVATSVDDIRIPPHIQEMLARSNPPLGVEERSRFSWEDEYELSIWRYRVRVLSMLMLFYYFMTLMASVSLWLHPEDEDEYPQGQFRQVKSDLPLTLVDTLENLLGITVSIVGLKAAVSNCTSLSKKFSREVTSLCLVHFVNLFMWIGAVFRGEIVQVPIKHRYHHTLTKHEQEEEMRSVVGFMLIIHPLLWISILSIAFRYHKVLEYRRDVLNPPEATPAGTPAATPAPEPVDTV